MLNHALGLLSHALSKYCMNKGRLCMCLHESREREEDHEVK